MLGADVCQKVYSPSGQLCGSIVQESKNTSTWGRDWLAKLRGDQRRAKADIAVLVSVTLPDSISHFGQMDGVWVTGCPLAACLAAALRMNLIQIAGLQQASKENGDVKMRLLHEYLSSTEFRNRIEAIVEEFLSMQSDLNRERVAMEGYWARRERQLRQVVDNVSGIRRHASNRRSLAAADSSVGTARDLVRRLVRSAFVATPSGAPHVGASGWPAARHDERATIRARREAGVSVREGIEGDSTYQSGKGNGLKASAGYIGSVAS